jgi:hypothetical protein
MLFFVLSSIFGRLMVSDSCKLDPSAATITIQGAEAAAPVDSLGAKLIKCQSVDLNPSMWLVEIDRGEAGTSSLRSMTNLMILQRSENSKQLRVLLSKKILEKRMAGGKPSQEEAKTKITYDVVLKPKDKPKSMTLKFSDGQVAEFDLPGSGGKK